MKQGLILLLASAMWGGLAYGDDAPTAPRPRRSILLSPRAVLGWLEGGDAVSGPEMTPHHPERASGTISGVASVALFPPAETGPALNWDRSYSGMPASASLLDPARISMQEEPKFLQVSLRAEIGAGPGAVGYILGPEAEFRLPRGLAITAHILHYAYHWEEDDDEEDGQGTGPGFEFRWYVARRAHEGFYIGSGSTILFGQWEGEYDDNGDGIIQPSEEDDGSEVSFEFHAAMGYMFQPSPNFAIGPTTILGWYVTSAEEGGGVFAGIGFRLGVLF